MKQLPFVLFIAVLAVAMYFLTQRSENPVKATNQKEFLQYLDSDGNAR